MSHEGPQSGSVKKKNKRKKKCYTKPALPLTAEDEEEPIPPLSPVLCNHHYPRLELVKPEHHGLYWVSPQYHDCDGKPRRRRGRKAQNNLLSAPFRTLRCAQSQDVRNLEDKPAIVDRSPTAKERFLYNTSHSPLPSSSLNAILVPETPINEQGLTLKQKLQLKSKRIQSATNGDRGAYVED